VVTRAHRRGGQALHLAHLHRRHGMGQVVRDRSIGRSSSL
jgi:hypothetical protein